MNKQRRHEIANLDENDSRNDLADAVSDLLDSNAKLARALREALDWALPTGTLETDGRHRTQGGYESRMMPMYYRLGDQFRADRLAALLDVLSEE